jgi:starch-binding outer membrane protein, SusD/RagB family
MKKDKFILFILITCMLIGPISCTNLDEKLYSELSTSGFYTNSDEVQSAVLRPYTHARAWAAPTGQQSYWRLTEYSGDQLAWPVKGIHGYDSGYWIRLHYHTWTTQDYTIQRAWELMYWGVGLCNDAIQNLQDRTASDMGIDDSDRSAYIAELRAFRAFHYLKIMDLWGNVPIVTVVGEPEYPATELRTDVFNFIESEILAVIDDLPVLTSSNIGRVTKAAGYAMLAELYLNAEIWTGTSRWDDCITVCDKLIAGDGGSQLGTIALDDDILIPFCNTNTVSSNENLFVLAYDYQSTSDYCSWNSDFYHFNQKYIYGGDKNGNDGAVVIPSAYDAFQNSDLRKSKWMLIGTQYYYSDPTTTVKGAYEYSGKDLVFVNNIRRNSESGTTSTMYTGEENSGARFNKYRSGAGTSATENYWSNDWALYRLTEIYFDKAEALMRKNGGSATQVAVDLINTCKKRDFSTEDWDANKYTIATLTLDELLAERGREFIFEGKRRTDLVRFGAFLTTDWWDHSASNDDNINLFPIPYSQTSINANLVQNTGY